MRFNTHLKPSSTLIDLTPLVDVMFLLLVFFLLTSEILPLKSLTVENPSLDIESPPLTAQVLVIMDAQLVLYVGHQKEIVDMASLAEVIKREVDRVQMEHPGGSPTVVLNIDRRVDYGAFLRLFALAQETGHRVRLAYQDA
ncbi:MAG: biopolymer transporter ExbD [Verrucomicrobia bacterium]|nr:biopolymer transporter ExbD [Verrucomicrobiota bacterium]